MNASPPEERPLIQALWIGDELPELVQISIRSFTEKGHPYHLYTYRSFPDLPPGCVLKDANEILPEKYVFRRRADGSVASFSDWFRFELLNKKGGYYVDTDIVCLKPFDLDEYFIGAVQGGRHAPARTLNGAVLRTKPGNLVCRLMCFWFRHPRWYVPVIVLYRSVMKVIRWDWRGWRHEMGLLRRDKNWLLGDPVRMRETCGVLLSHFAYQGLAYVSAVWLKIYAVMPQHYFYPHPYSKRAGLMDDTYEHTDNPFPDSYAVHLWYNEWDQFKKARPHPNSLWERLRRQYLPDR